MTSMRRSSQRLNIQIPQEDMLHDCPQPHGRPARLLAEAGVKITSKSSTGPVVDISGLDSLPPTSVVERNILRNLFRWDIDMQEVGPRWNFEPDTADKGSSLPERLKGSRQVTRCCEGCDKGIGERSFTLVESPERISQPKKPNACLSVLRSPKPP